MNYLSIQDFQVIVIIRETKCANPNQDDRLIIGREVKGGKITVHSEQRSAGFYPSISRNASRSRRRWSHIRLRRTTKRRRIRGNRDGCGGGRRTGRVGSRGRRRGRGRSRGDGGGGGRRGGRALPHCSAVPGCKPRTGTPRPTPSPPPPPTLR
ncbi:unnamed protein product [Musa acuminata subsp. burmannicoides]